MHSPSTLLLHTKKRDRRNDGHDGNIPFPKYYATYARPQELERHIRENHMPNQIYCKQQGCHWTGTRRYALQNQLSEKHPCVPMPEQEALTICDEKGLVKLLLDEEISVKEAVGEVRLLFQQKALQLGKLETRRWMRALKAASSL